MYFDSGAYMEMAINLEPSFHRAFGFPLLMKWTGWGISNWPIIFLQGLLVSWLLYQLIKITLPGMKSRWPHFLTILLLSVGSALPWYAAQLMPDIWTFILVLAFCVLALNKELTIRDLVLLGAISLFAMLTHLSHIPLILLLLVSVFVLSRFFIPMKEHFDLRRWVGLSSPFVLAFLVTCSFNAAYGMGFRLSLSSNAFITANLGEMGILKFYLDEQCQTLDTKLCELKDELPRETYGYLWDPNGPVQKHPGGWEGANDEYSVIVHDFLTKPRYTKWLIIASVKATFKQMFQIEIGSGLQYAYGEGTPPYWPMKSHFKQELNEYLTSVQNKGDDLPIDFFRWLNYLSLIMSIGIIAWAVIQRKLTFELALLLMLLLCAYFYNAAITGVLANVYERLQARLLPSVQLMAVLIVFHHWGNRILGSTES